MYGYGYPCYGYPGMGYNDNNGFSWIWAIIIVAIIIFFICGNNNNNNWNNCRGN